MWKFEIFKDPDAGWRWRLVAHNALILLESPTSYERRIDAKQAAQAARDGIGKADVVVL